MCSVQGSPSPGTTVSLRVSFVDLHPEVPLVRLWGRLGERREEYARLHQDIQAKAGPRLVGAPGALWPAAGAGLCPGDLCLVELGDHWHRCRVVSRQGQHCRVFLLDEGRTVVAGAYYLARGADEFFHLPSEVLGCVLADLVPPGAGAAAAGGGEQPAASWTGGALEFLGYLHGKEVSGLVREVLMPQRLVLLELPGLLAQMHHLGLAQQVTPSCFRALLKRCLAVPRLHGQPKPEPPGPTSATQYLAATGPQPGPAALDFFYPRLQLGVTEPVLVTQISDPHRVYCQLQSLSQEIQRLSDSLHQMYEAAARREQDPLPTPGSPCAARGIDGRWYRALLLEIFPVEQGRLVAQVICVDYGRKEFVTGANLRRLSVEYFRMPVVTYPCALQGILDGGCGWSRSQLSGLKALLLGKAVSARIEAYSPFEHLYYVNLYGENGLNLNCLYGVQARCLAHSLLQGGQGAQEQPAEEDAAAPKEPGLPPSDTLPATAAQRGPAAARLPGVRLKVGVFYDAQVSFVRDPSEFWMRLKEYRLPFNQMMRSMSDFYSRAQKLDGIVLEPQPRSLCCAKWKENAYYRAVITRVLGNGVEVHLVDRGNREIVDWYEVKELLPQFRELPAVALKCCLADASPLGETWSKESVAHFKRTVQSKELVIQVLSTQGDKYVIEILDQSQTGEKNISKILSQEGYAKFQGAEISEALQKLSTQSLGRDPKEPVGKGELVSSTARKSGVQAKTIRDNIVLNPSVPLTVKDQPTAETCRLSSDSAPDEKQNKGNLNLPSSLTQYYLEIKPGSPYEGQLEVGSTVEVVISYAESPGYFWCQLSRNNQELNSLMAEIQDYCKTSVQPHRWASPVCLAKYSEDEKWYRALIISGDHSTEQVEVIYVDYGNKELVSIKNLCSINANFLKLKAQAFRCSLYNLIQPNGQDPFVWDEKAVLAFQEFVDTTDHLELKCTMFALAAINNKELFNVVDLITPFQSVCHFLTEKGLARPVPPQQPLAPSVQLHSYYYSTHDIKIGSEEEIYVTHVDNPGKFYCQLARSANVLEQLTNSIGRLSKALHSFKMSQKPGNLYLARYTDSHWYRGVVLKTKPNKEVFFVDFGNTQVVKKEDLIPIPSDAYDILLLPIQAIKCSLSDISNVPKEATTWFETAVLDKPLKMIVVAKESDGKLVVELYDSNIQINAKMKEGLSLPRNRESNKYVENKTLHSKNKNAKEGRNENMKSSATYMRKSEDKTWRSEIQGEECNTKTDFVCKDVKHFQPAAKRESSTKFLGSVERINTNKVCPSASNPFVGKEVGENKSLPFIKKEKMSDIVKLDTVKARNQGENSTLFPLKNICDLPPRNLVPGLKTLVYISHVNNPSDFYIQLASDESQLNNISEGLNDKTGTEGLSQEQLQVGDLISAVFSEDGLWYRAVVKEKLSDERISVQYIDYGNTSVVNVCETSRLLEKYSSIPMMSIHSSLAGVQSKQLTNWTQESMSYFSERTSEVQINCEFVEKLKDRWEIVLYDEQGMIAADWINETFTMREESKSTEALDRREGDVDVLNQCDLLPFDEKNKASSITDSKSFFWKTPEVAQTVETYVTVIKSPEYFWCQMADPENINYLEKKLQETGELEISSMDDFRSSIKSGDICIAKYSEDGKLYRAKVCSINSNNLFVRHVDYGSEELVGREMVRQIPDKLLTIPMQAFPCCLSGFNSPEGSWSNEAKEKFYDMTAEYLLEVTVIEIQKDSSSEIPLSVVKLECNGKNINEEMKCFWKYNADTTLANIQNTLSEKNEGPGTDNTNAVCLEKAVASTEDAKQENSALLDALLCAELFHLTDSGCLNTAEIEEKVILKTSDEHQINSEILNKVENPLFKKESDSKTKVYVEPKASEPQLLASSETKDLDLEQFEARFLEDDELKAEMLELSLEVQSFLGEERKELLELPSTEVQPSLGENVKLLEMEQLQKHSSLHEVKKVLLELESLVGLESLEGHPSLGDRTKKEMLELESLEMQTSLINETKEELSELESLQVQLLDDETGELMKLKSLEVSSSFSNRENWLEMESSLEIQPVCGGDERGKLFELIPGEVQISLGEETKERVDWDLDLLEVHQMKAVPTELEVESFLVKTLLSNGARKELEPETHKVKSSFGTSSSTSFLSAPSEVQASLGDEIRKDPLELDLSILELSADKLSCPKTDLKKQMPNCPVELCGVRQTDSRGEKCKKWLTLQEKSCAEQMKPELHEVFIKYKNTLVSGESLRHKLSDEEEIEIREKQDATLAGHGAEQSEHACTLEGFAVGSKCMVWTCLKWSEARILEISDEGTRVLNLSSGNEEIVNPENVWNGIPEGTKSPYEAAFHVTNNLHTLSETGSELKEKRDSCGSDVMVDQYMLSSSPKNATE